MARDDDARDDTCASCARFGWLRKPGGRRYTTVLVYPRVGVCSVDPRRPVSTVTDGWCPMYEGEGAK